MFFFFFFWKACVSWCVYLPPSCLRFLSPPSTPPRNCLVFLQYRCSFKGIQWFSSQYGPVSSLITLHEGGSAVCLAHNFTLLGVLPLRGAITPRVCPPTGYCWILFPTTVWGCFRLESSSVVGYQCRDTASQVECCARGFDGSEWEWPCREVQIGAEVLGCFLVAGSDA